MCSPLYKENITLSNISPFSININLKSISSNYSTWLKLILFKHNTSHFFSAYNINRDN